MWLALVLACVWARPPIRPLEGVAPESAVVGLPIAWVDRTDLAPDLEAAVRACGFPYGPPLDAPNQGTCLAAPSDDRWYRFLNCLGEAEKASTARALEEALRQRGATVLGPVTSAPCSDEPGSTVRCEGGLRADDAALGRAVWATGPQGLELIGPLPRWTSTRDYTVCRCDAPCGTPSCHEPEPRPPRVLELPHSAPVRQVLVVVPSHREDDEYANWTPGRRCVPAP